MAKLSAMLEEVKTEKEELVKKNSKLVNKVSDMEEQYEKSQEYAK